MATVARRCEGVGAGARRSQEIYSVLRNLCRRGYATQVGRMTNPLLSSCDEDDSDEDDE
ncbi:hypothetical protein GXU00_005332 [Escherichia coli]|nr:hypothetical protein [Escherichia coli]EFI4233184.1 hypothetical protein [Escherichia coli]